MDDPIAVAPGITRYECHWGYYLHGRKDALIAAGLAQADWFPSGREKNHRGQIARQVDLVHEGRAITCRQTSTHQFDVAFKYTADEQERNRERETYAAALSGERERISSLPNSADDFRGRAAGCVELDAMLSILFETGYGGYRFAPEVAEAARDKMEELTDILRSGRVLFSEKRRQSAIAHIKSNTAKADPALQRLLGDISKGIA